MQGTSGLEEVADLGVTRGELVALVVAPDVGVAVATATRCCVVRSVDVVPVEVVRHLEDELRPRWLMWSNETALALVGSGLRVATAWDIAAVHRLIFGGWRADAARVWAQLHDLAVDAIPTTKPLDLFSDPSDLEHDDAPEPVRSDGYLRPDWVNGGWSTAPERLARWAELAVVVSARQLARLAELPDCPRAPATARVESAAELLCAELAVDGLPIDRSIAEELIAGFVGPRPTSDAEAAGQRARRDAEVLRHVPAAGDCDLRSAGQVKALLGRVGFDVADTRASTLESLRDAHPLIGALLAWRKAERVATTYGYAWIDENLDADGRLRGTWSGSDGAAGRMTASAGLHNMPADMRPAVMAEPGHVFVRADLGQIEPRVLAAVSGDRSLASATADADMYAPVAQQLGVDRATAKVAVLGAMYGQTTGHGARALRRLDDAYPVAMRYLQDADRAGQTGTALRTYGGRLISFGAAPPSASVSMYADAEVGDPGVASAARSRAAAMGRYGRNAMVQGAAAELFKTWAVTVRARAMPLDAHIVLCLHDELLVHAPVAHGDAVAQLLHDCLREAAHRWAPDDSVCFVADVSVITRWSDAKD